jgi:hypothetical protein
MSQSPCVAVHLINHPSKFWHRQASCNCIATEACGSFSLLQIIVNKRSVNGVLKLAIRQYATGMVVFCIEWRFLSIQTFVWIAKIYGKRR